jgi:predicted ABC-type ATPase
VIAGPNGAGKTTFARRYLPAKARVIHFVNADLIAAGLSPLKPELAAIAAARMVLREIDRLAKARADFAFESTLSGLTYVRRLESWRREGYRVEIVYLRLKSSQLALRRVAARVRDADMTYLGEMAYGGTPKAGTTFIDLSTVGGFLGHLENSGQSPQLLEQEP